VTVREFLFPHGDIAMEIHMHPDEPACLPGFVCEHCFDAPATVVMPAPTGDTQGAREPAMGAYRGG
jgi:hypothetical protein